MLRKYLTVIALTFLSRVTGFARDVFLATYLGSSGLADSFFIAFRLPNHFRAIFSEGAFTASFIPLYSDLLHKRTNDYIKFRDQLFTVVFCVQILVCALFLIKTEWFITLFTFGQFHDTATLELLRHLIRITFPYFFLISLVSLFSALLNSHQRFVAASFCPMLLNLSLILFLCFSTQFKNPAFAASYAVVFAGVAQVLLLWFVCYKHGITPNFTFFFSKSRELIRFFRLLLPAILSNSMTQIGALIDTMFASYLPVGSLSVLYYADRLYQLPFALIGISLQTVMLPTLSQLISKKDYYTANKTLNKLTVLCALMVSPIIILYSTLAEDIVNVIFNHGAFRSEALPSCAKILLIYSSALPAVIAVRLIVSSFYARKNMRIPFYSGLIALCLNLACKQAFVVSFGVYGLAMATSLSQWVYLGILVGVGCRKGYFYFEKTTIKWIASLVSIAAIFGVISSLIRGLLLSQLHIGLVYVPYFTLMCIGIPVLLLYGLGICIMMRAIRV